MMPKDLYDKVDNLEAHIRDLEERLEKLEKHEERATYATYDNPILVKKHLAQEYASKGGDKLATMFLECLPWAEDGYYIDASIDSDGNIKASSYNPQIDDRYFTSHELVAFLRWVREQDTGEDND